MKAEQKKVRIGEFAEFLQVERFVIRFWEKEFKISSERSSGGQRFYTADVMEKFKIIKELLYEKGYTIAGAKKHLKKLSKSSKQEKSILAASKTSMIEATESQEKTTQPIDNNLVDQLVDFREKLINLRELL